MIISRSNPRIKEIRLLHQARHRHARGEYFIEGVRLVEEALQHRLPVLKVVYSPRLEETPRGARLLARARQELPAAEWLHASDEVLQAVADAETHQGVLLVLRQPQAGGEEIFGRGGIILLLQGLQDPGNLGMIFRVAEAGGAAGLILSAGSVDPFSPKVLRSSMGSLFRVPFQTGQAMKEKLMLLRRRGYRTWAAAVRGGDPFWQVDFSRPSAVLFGQEGSGLPPELIEAAGGLCTIPMRPGVESLNTAMAAGLVVYEAFRQKAGIERMATAADFP